MKIYRAISQKEYNCLNEKKSLKSKRKTVWGRPERFVDLKRASDGYGKFFFFYLQDAVFFCNTFRDNGYSGRDNILEMDITEEEAFPFLTCGGYAFYEDESPEKKTVHSFPELYLPIDFVDKKFAEGQVRVISYGERKDIYPYPLSNSSREPNYVTLGNAIDEIAAERERIDDIQNIINRQKFLETLDEKNPQRVYLRPKDEVEQMEKDVEEEKWNLVEAIDNLKTIFHNFAREHEKYMKLVLVKNEENDTKNAE